MKKILVIFLFLSQMLFASDLTDALKEIEKGNVEKAKFILSKLEKSSADYQLLSALLDEDGTNAYKKYQSIVKDFPEYRFNEIAFFRMYSYNFAIGNYKTAENYLTELEGKFPNSPYLNIQKYVPNLVQDDENNENNFQNYSIQIGAFLNNRNALTLVRKVEDLKLEARIEKKIVGKSIFYVVKVGDYNSKKDAEIISQKIIDKLKIEGKIVSN